MNDYTRIDRLIREAGVQRSAAIGTAIGEFLGNTWLLGAKLSRKAAAALRNDKVRLARQTKTVPAR